MGRWPTTDWAVGAAESMNSGFSERLTSKEDRQPLGKTPNSDLCFPHAGAHRNMCAHMQHTNTIHEIGSH